MRYGVENKLVCVDKNSAEQHIQKRLKEFRNPEQSFDVLRKNETWIRCSNKKTNDGRTLCLREDITASKLAEKKLINNEERFKHFSHSTADWFWETDKDNKFTFISEGLN